MKNTIVFVHGLFSNAIELELLRRRFSDYKTVSINLDTLTTPVPKQGKFLRDSIRELPGIVHVVAHSLGGIVTIHAYAQGNMPPGRVVMLGPPLRGCAKARHCKEQAYGFIVRQTFSNGLDGNIPKWDRRRDLGIIAGTLDTTVALPETQVRYGDHLTLDVTHHELLTDYQVAQQARHYLEHGDWIGGAPRCLLPEHWEARPRPQYEMSNCEVGLYAGCKVGMGLFHAITLALTVIEGSLDRKKVRYKEGTRTKRFYQTLSKTVLVSRIFTAFISYQFLRAMRKLKQETL